MADEDKGISRRKFVVGAAAGVAAAAAVGSVGTYLLKPTPAAVTTTETQTQTTTQTTTVQPGLPSSWDYTADVVVVGGGIAGLSASIEARKAGASVILLEKEAAVGGATIMSGGLVYAAGTSVQQKFGITDTAAAMIAHYTHAARGRADTNQIAIAANTSAGNIDWLIQQGATFPAAPTVSGAEVCEGQPAIPRVHAVYTSNGKTSGGPAVIAVLKPAAQNAGVQIMTGTAAQSLIVRGAKEVVGVVAQTGSSTINVKAVLKKCHKTVKVYNRRSLERASFW